MAPLVTTTFNEAKSEIKWIEAAAVKVVTVASNLGAFEEMIQDGVTGVLADDNEWESKLERLILEQDLREQIAENYWLIGPQVLRYEQVALSMRCCFKGN